MQVRLRLTTIVMRQNVSIEQICALVNECYMSYRTLSIQDKINKLNHILFLISLVEEEDIYLLSKKDTKEYKKAIEWVWAKLQEIGYKIVDNNYKAIDHKINEEEDLSKLSKEDLSKLSKEELIDLLKEATK